MCAFEQEMKFSSTSVTPFFSASRRHLCSGYDSIPFLSQLPHFHFRFRFPRGGINLTDKQLHQRYNIFSKFKVLSNLTSQSNVVKFQKLSTDLGFVGPPGSFWTYTDLHVTHFITHLPHPPHSTLSFSNTTLILTILLLVQENHFIQFMTSSNHKNLMIMFKGHPTPPPTLSPL
jgi:hypothetical protein